MLCLCKGQHSSMAESTIFRTEDKQEHVEYEESSSFCYKTIVKEELIIEDVLKPLPENDEGQDTTEIWQDQSAADENDSDDVPKSSNVHPSNKKWHCEKCNKSYPNSKAFSVHKYRHKVMESGQFTCQHCKRLFLDNCAMGRHKCTGKAPENPVPGKSFTCKECFKAFAKPDALQRHKNRHKTVKEAKFKCETCEKCFGDRIALTRHELYVHKIEKKAPAKQLIKDSGGSEDDQSSKAPVERDENGFFKCPDCDMRFEIRSRYTTHVRHHVALRHELYKCKICKLIFKTSYELKRHERSHEYQKSKKSSNPYGLIRPEATLKEENGLFMCSVCEKTFEQRREALFHLMRHCYVKRNKIQCNLCPMTFVSKKCLEKHQVEHETPKDVTSSESSSEEESGSDDSSMDGDSEFKCTACNKTFWEQRMLNRHIRTHQVMMESKFPCKLCSMRCGSRRQLIKHEEMHARKRLTVIGSDEKVPPIILERNNHTVYKCSECAKIFTKQRNYYIHAQTHVNVKNETFMCETCGTCCSTRKYFLVHMARHRAGQVKTRKLHDNRHFECPECGKKFSQRSYLVQHFKWHEAVEKGTFQCKVCAKFFGSRVRLARHEAIHRGKESLEELKCSECDRISASKHTLAAHLLRHEAKRNGTFECKVCGKRMGSKYDLEAHTNKHAVK